MIGLDATLDAHPRPKLGVELPVGPLGLGSEESEEHSFIDNGMRLIITYLTPQYGLFWERDAGRHCMLKRKKNEAGRAPLVEIESIPGR